MPFPLPAHDSFKQVNPFRDNLALTNRTPIASDPPVLQPQEAGPLSPKDQADLPYIATRSDFANADGWDRHRHNAGIRPNDEDSATGGSGYHSLLYSAVHDEEPDNDGAAGSQEVRR